MSAAAKFFYTTTDGRNRLVGAYGLLAAVIMGVLFAFVLTTPQPALGQLPVISSFSRNGELSCSNLEPGSVATVEWSASVAGPWTNSWAGLDSVMVDSNGMIRVSVPMFYRVRGVAQTNYSALTNMVWIAGGSFTMGSPSNELGRFSDEAQHPVTLTKGFYMGKYLVTQGQYLALLGGNPSFFQTNDANGNPISPDLNRPVETVSWDDATNFCALLTQSDRAAGRMPTNWSYRLPTEAEWEYACRAGTTTAFYFGSAIRGGMANFYNYVEYDANIGLIHVANPSVPCLQRTSSVGSYVPNAFGLYDMHGNVWEWCQDWKGTYSVGSVSDPQGPATGDSRILRGGCWGNDGNHCRSAERIGRSPTFRNYYIGFRVVLAPSDPQPPSGMALIPAGSFTMGDTLGDVYGSELPLHTNYVSASYMDKCEVTKALWDDVYNWAITHGYSFEYGAQGRESNHPAHSMTWYDAVKWCNARSEREGRVPAYYTSVGQTTVYRSWQIGVQNDWVKWNAGYRLPTEAEWEKAAQGGIGGQRFPWGNTISWSQANYHALPLSAGGYAYDVNPTNGYHPTFHVGVTPYTSPVGYFTPGGYGLYDMAGNVWEWCWDWYGPYSSSPQNDPQGHPTGSFRVFRGGSWGDLALQCRTTRRENLVPGGQSDKIGFRCVLPATQP